MLSEKPWRSPGKVRSRSDCQFVRIVENVEVSHTEAEELGSARIVLSPGTLPSFWDRNVVFIANLLGLFFGNEEQSQLLAKEVGEVDSYGGRLVPILNLVYRGKGRNALILECEPDASLCRYHEEVAGLSLPDRQVLSHRDYLDMGREFAEGTASSHPFLESISGGGASWMDGYVTDNTLEHIAAGSGKKTISTGPGSLHGNNKRELHLFLEQAGLPTVATELADSPAELNGSLERIREQGFRSGVIKSAMGASGIGLIKVDSLEDTSAVAASVPEHFFFEGPCLVQGWLCPGEQGVSRVRSPSAQLFLDDKSVVIYDLTEQILSQSSVHEGNESPPPYLADHPEWKAELLRQAGLAGRWLHEQGYRGTGSVDFLLVECENGEVDVYVCEINARVTGATYPSVLARHFLPEGSWLLRNLRFETPLLGEELLALLEKSGDLFVPGRSETGVLPVNFNRGRDGLVHKGQFLCVAHSTAGSHVLLELAELDLPCVPDRD